MDDGKLPEPSTELVLMGALLRALDLRHEGLLDELLDTLGDEAVKAEVIRLRGPRLEPQMKQHLADARFWLATMRAAHRGVMPKAKKRFSLFRK